MNKKLREKVKQLLKFDNNIDNFDMFYNILPKKLAEEGWQVQICSNVFLKFNHYDFFGQVMQIKKGRSKENYLYLIKNNQIDNSVIVETEILLNRQDLILN
jgi:hypothetical protein